MDLANYVARRSFDAKTEATAIDNALSYSANDSIVVHLGSKPVFAHQKKWMMAYNPKTNQKGYVCCK